jgi:hypothetical protein
MVSFNNIIINNNKYKFFSEFKYSIDKIAHLHSYDIKKITCKSFIIVKGESYNKSEFDSILTTLYYLDKLVLQGNVLKNAVKVNEKNKNYLKFEIKSDIFNQRSINFIFFFLKILKNNYFKNSVKYTKFNSLEQYTFIYKSMYNLISYLEIEDISINHFFLVYFFFNEKTRNLKKVMYLNSKFYRFVKLYNFKVKKI